MNVFIKWIFIFGANDEQREVKLEPGLNIITGDSKTGKSAILEIVDYCLFSSRSTIPKGVVENFSELYSIVLKVAEKYIVIARPSKRTGKQNKVYMKIETDRKFLENISKSYFSNISLRQLKEVQSEFEKHLGMSVLDTRTDKEEDKRNAGKATMRSFTSLILQHQNLIANKHSIFYRFDDYYKRKKTIEDFPILIGWESSEYFLYARELEEITKELKAHNKLVKSMKLKDVEIQERLKGIIENYYTLVGLELDSRLSLSKLKVISRKLPEVPNNSYENTDLGRKIQYKKDNREELRIELLETQGHLALLEKNSSLSRGHVSQLNFLEMTSSLDIDENEPSCPICKNTNIQLKEEISIISDSRRELKSELEKIGTYNEDNSEQIEELRKKRNSLKQHIRQLSSEITTLEKQDQNIIKNNTLREQAFLAKGRTEANISTLLSNNNEVYKQTDVKELKERIDFLREKLEEFDLQAKIKNAEIFLSKKMTTICESLDFEEELKPGELRFSLEKFDFYYHFDNKEKIHLSEMGSGANWLACHLSLFLALLHLNCKEKNSSIPSLLFIDQPSQVYFPTKYNQLEEDNDNNLDENIVQVKNIFKVISDTLSIIEEDCGFLPQVVVMEHADEEEFAPYVRKRWKKDGEKLI